MRRYITCFLLISIFYLNISIADFNEGYAAYVEGDFTTALKEFEPLANNGEADAQYNLAVMYLNGQGVAVNAATAVDLLKLAAEQNFTAAQHALGTLYNAKDAEFFNESLAAYWFKQAAESGFTESQYYLGSMYQYGKGDLNQSFSDAVKWYSLAAEKGQNDAQYALGILYRMGKGVEKNDIIATKYFMQAAENGSSYRNFQVAHAYYNGLGIKQDYVEAHNWYTLAAKEGNTASMFRLGLIYNKGYGVEKNNSVAYLWWSIAAKLKHATAAEFLTQLQNNMSSVQLKKSEEISSMCIKDNFNRCVSIGENSSFITNTVEIQDPFVSARTQSEHLDIGFMGEQMLGAGIFGAIAAAISLALSFLILKAFRVNKPSNNKLFYILMAVTMLSIYILRSYISTNI